MRSPRDRDAHSRFCTLPNGPEMTSWLDMASPDFSLSGLARSNVNSWWGAVTAELLWRLGVKTVVISPGSRSTPLTFACAAHGKLETPVILDERSAAFFALGLAKARQEPVALLCTSGTAVANYLPAVIEASESGTPLLVLSADRPPELRYRHAGQTIDQIKILGDAVRFFAEAMLPEAQLTSVRAWRDLLAQAIARSTGGHPGPVHVNCPFREPLGPEDGVDAGLPELPAEFLTGVRPPPVVHRSLALPPDLPRAGWIIAGPQIASNPGACADAVGRLAAHLGWPVLADALSPCRHHLVSENVQVVTTYDTILRNAGASEAVRPEGVLQLGDLPTSKVLRQRLTAWQLPTWIVDPAPESRNAAAVPAIHLACLAEELEFAGAAGRNDGTHRIGKYEQAVRRQLDAALETAGAPREPQVARALIESAPRGTPLFLAGSMPVRDAEYFWPFNDAARPIYFNRGANGIDGTLSSALGVAEAVGKPTVLYTGELALLHDTNGLLAGNSAFAGSLTIVCINNGGGGIFEHLPIARQGPIFERCFATPQKVDFGKWAAAYDVGFRRIDSLEDLQDALSELPLRGVRLLEVKTDRRQDAAWRRQTFARIAEEL